MTPDMNRQAVERIAALHYRNTDGNCGADSCTDSEYGASEWPCETLDVLWQLGDHVEGPSLEPIQGPSLTFRLEIERYLTGITKSMEDSVTLQVRYPPLHYAAIPTRIHLTEEQLRLMDL